MNVTGHMASDNILFEVVDVNQATEGHRLNALSLHVYYGDIPAHRQTGRKVTEVRAFSVGRRGGSILSIGPGCTAATLTWGCNTAMGAGNVLRVRAESHVVGRGGGGISPQRALRGPGHHVQGERA